MAIAKAFGDNRFVPQNTGPLLRPFLTEPLTTEQITVAIADLPAHLADITLVQLSDFHFDGRSLSPKILSEAIAQCNAIDPDLVVLTGDFVTNQAHEIHALIPYLQQLQSRCGVYAILGNHDNRYNRYYQTRTVIRQALVANGIPTLWNEIAYPFGPELPLVGLADFYSKEFRPAPVFAQLDARTPRIVLSHNPDSLVALKPFRADLVLSGHTHGGQVTIPGWGAVPGILQAWGAVIPNWARPFIPFLRKDCDRVLHHWEWAAGLHTLGQNQLYVNRGLGSYFPGRLFCPPEITVIRLVGQV
ncbi:MAG: metallophosphoesterase [Cyanobacteria bacterium P01_D01_bin.71]